MSGPGRARRVGSRTLSWSGVALASALLLLSAPQAWVRISADGASTSLSGTSLTGGLSQALSVVPPLALLLSLTLRARGRQVVGGLLLLVGLAAVVLGVRPPQPSEAEVQAALSTVALAGAARTGPTPWPPVFAVAGLLLVLAAVTMLLRAPRWPSRAARYETTTTGIDPDDPAATWRALDQGQDPTLPPPAPSPDPIPADPISSDRGGGDTMGPDTGPERRPEGTP